MKRLVVIALALAVAAVAVSSATAKGPFGGVYQTTVKGQAAQLNGVWLLSFKANGAYTVTKKPASTVLIGGTATMSGTTLAFRDSKGLLACPGGTRGTYSWAVSGKKLTLKILKDPCPGRPLVLAGSAFTKIR